MLPVFLVLSGAVPFYAACIKCGEFSDIQDAIEKQREDESVLIGYAYNEQRAYYKLTNANYYEADLIALGTSRVMQFKADYFSSEFYNCGGGVEGNYDEYINFLENLTYKPETILLGIDAWVFNDAWNSSCTAYDDFVNISMVERDKLAMLKSIISDWSSKKWTFEDLKSYSYNVGFNGCIKDSGFMYDGSYYYGDIYRNPEEHDRQFLDIHNRVVSGKNRFEWGADVDSDTVIQLQNLLEYCRENNIRVIGFLTPFAPSIYSEMLQSGNYGYIEEMKSTCQKIFDTYSFELYDYVDGAVYGVTDAYYIDGYHGSEVVYGYILKDMCEQGSEIGKYIDMDELAWLLDNAYSELVFKNPHNRIVD